MPYEPLLGTSHCLSISYRRVQTGEHMLFGAPHREIEMTIRVALPIEQRLCDRVSVIDIAEGLDETIKARLADEGPQLPTTPSGRPRRRLLDE